MTGRAATLALTGLLMASSAVAGGAKLPPWAAAALAAGTPPAQDAPAVILFDEAVVTPATGVSSRTRYERRTLLKILTSEGESASFQPIEYSKQRRLAGFRAWTIRPDGSALEFERSRVVDVGLSTFTEFSDARQTILPLRGVGVGSSVALEYQLDRDDFFFQDLWRFQRAIPVKQSRFVLDVPEGWDVEQRILNAPALDPRREGTRRIWEMRDLPGIEGHPDAAPWSDVAATLAVTYFPHSRDNEGRAFRTWDQVAAWYAALVGPQTLADEAIREVVRGVGSADRADLVRRLARYVQALRYVTVDLGLSAYQPHPSPEVFRNRYGDCKDKATLLITMLREAGIGAYPVLVNSRPAGRVFPDFPSPIQFNHVIVAIPAAPDMPVAATTDDPSLGKVLLFDPTDDQTPLGDLPWSDQGTKGLLIRSEKGGLLELPTLPADASRAERAWTVRMGTGGATEIEMKATYTGQYARLLRYRYGALTESERQQRMLASLGRVPGARLDSLAVSNLEDPARPVELEARFQVQRYGRFSGPVHITQPLAVAESLAPVLGADPHGVPTLLPFRFEEADTVTLLVPPGWRPSEIPPPTNLSAPYGEFSIAFASTDGGLRVDRRLRLEAREIALDAYADARKFFDEVGRSSGATVVLERAPS